MANRIKGITIEIGGDTTKLDKALSGTNKTISQTQKALQDVERLLKMDPGNTELLEQKQRLLAQSVEATAEKLQTLRQAADSADQALKRGNDYRAAYEPLKGALDDVNASMRALEDNAEGMKRRLEAGDISTAQYDEFSKKLDNTRRRAGELEQAIETLNKEFSGAKIDQRQYDAIQRELAETEQAAKDAEDEFSKFNATAEKFSAGSQAIATGAGKVSSATQGLSTAAAGILAAAVATVPATEELRNSMANLQINAENAGVSLGTAQAAMQNFVVVSGELDSSLEATSNLLQAGFTESNLQKAVENLAGAYLQFPDTLKIESLADSLQETLATGEATGQFGELLDRLGVGAENFNAQLALIPNELDRQNFALETLAQNGLANTYEAWTQSNEAIIENRTATYEFQTAMAQLAETVQPFLTTFVQMATQILEWFNSLPPGVQAAIGVFIALVAAISPIAGIISAIGLAAGAAGVAFSTWLPIILAVVAALVLLAGIIAVVNGSSSNTSAQRSGGFSSSTTRSAEFDSVPHLASGGVVPPNNPFLAVLGDNTREQEIVAPYSTIKQATSDAIAERGGNTTTTIIVKAKDGFTRNLSFALSEESVRKGVSLVSN